MRAPSSAVVAPTCEAVLGHDLPGLDEYRRREVVDFVCRRLSTLPVHMRWGVAVIAFVVDGDRIRLDVGNGTLDILVDPSEIDARMIGFTPPAPRYTTGVLAKYRKLVGSAAGGAVCD